MNISVHGIGAAWFSVGILEDARTRQVVSSLLQASYARIKRVAAVRRFVTEFALSRILSMLYVALTVKAMVRKCMWPGYASLRLTACSQMPTCRRLINFR